MGKYPKKRFNLDYADKKKGLRASDIYARDVNPKISPNLKQNIDQKLDKHLNIPIYSIGDLNYLPLDIKGAFYGNAFYASNLVYLQEQDGTVVGLRPGWNGEIKRYFYCYNDNINATDNWIVTDIEYRVPILDDDEYLIRHLGTTIGDGFLFLTSKNRVIYIQHKGVTLNPAEVTCYDLTANIPVTFSFGWKEPHIGGTYYPAEDLLFVTYFEFDPVQYCYHQTKIYVTHPKAGTTVVDGQVLFDGTDTNDIIFLEPEGSPSSRYNLTDRGLIIAPINDGKTIRLVDPLYGSINYVTATRQYPVTVFLTYDYDISTGQLTDLYPNRPYTFDPAQDNVRDVKFYPVVIYGAFSPYGTCFFSFINDRQFIFSRISQISSGSWNGLRDFGKDNISLADMLFNLSKHLIGPYHDSAWVIRTLDPNYLGKVLSGSRFVTEKDIIVDTTATVFPNISTATRQSVKVSLSGLDPTRTVLDREALPLPSSVEIYPNKLSQAIVQATLWDTTKTNPSIEIHSYFNENINNYYVVTDVANGIYEPSNTTFPSDTIDQLTNFVRSDPDDFYINRRHWTLIPINRDNLFILHYIASKGTTINVKICLVELTSSGLDIKQDTLTTLYTGTNWGTPWIWGYRSAAIVITTDYIYIMADGVHCANAGWNFGGPFMAKIDRSTKTFVSAHLPPLYGMDYSWLNITYGIHPYYGPYRLMSSYSYNDTQTDITFIDHRTDITDPNQRVVQCFEDLLNKVTTNLTSFTCLTIASLSGFYCYTGSFKSFMFGTETVQPTAQYDLTDIDPDPSNKSFYIYLTPYDKDHTKLIFEQNYTPESYKLPIGQITTNDKTVQDITIYDKTYLGDGIRVSADNTKYATLACKDDVELNRSYNPKFVRCAEFQYLTSAVTKNESITNPKIVTGVCRLNQYASTIYTLDNIVVPGLNKINSVIIANVNCGDGYNHAYLDLGTYTNTYTYNIVDNTFSVKVFTGDPVNVEYLWIHWIAIGS